MSVLVDRLDALDGLINMRRSLIHPAGQANLEKVLRWLESKGGRIQITLKEALAETGMADKTFRRAIENLTLLGAIIVQPGGAGFGEGRFPNIYIQQMTHASYVTHRDAIIGEIHERINANRRAKKRALDAEKRRRRKEAIALASEPTSPTPASFEEMLDVVDDADAWLA